METQQIYVVVALAAYALLMLFVGIFSYGKTKTLDGFLIGGRNIGAWMTAFS